MLLKVRKFHKWLGIVIGVQLLFWTASGIYFAWIPIDEVRGRTEAVAAKPVLAAGKWVAPAEIMARTSLSAVHGLELKSIGGIPYYIVRGEGGRERYDARSGEAAFPLSAAEAEARARADFLGEAGVLSVELVERDPPGEFKRALPAWRVALDNPGRTHIYVDAVTGEISARRNRLWRWYDLLWMLHIMDYGEREDFNNPLVRGVSIAAMVVVLSGFLMFWLLSRRRRAVSKPRA